MKVDRFLESTGQQPYGAVTFDALKTILEHDDPPANSPENAGPANAATTHVATPSPATPAPGSTPPGGVPTTPA